MQSSAAKPSRLARQLAAGCKPALLICECQPALVSPGVALVEPLARKVAAHGILPRIARLAAGFRAADVPVIHCGIAIDPHAPPTIASRLQAAMARHLPLRVTDPTSYFHPTVAPLAGDRILMRSDGLLPFDDALLALIRAEAIDVLVLCGVSTDLALPCTAVLAVQHGLSVVVAADCVAGTVGDGLDGVLAALATIADSGTILGASTLHAKEDIASK